MSISGLQLTEQDQELIAFARRVVDENDDHRVHATAAAVHAEDGRMFGGINDRGRGPIGPCGRDRQVLFDYHPDIRVILPTEDGLRSVRITDLLPLGSVWDIDEGTKPFDPTMF